MISLSEEEKFNIRHYKYSGGDTSPIYGMFLSPWAQFCVDNFIPLSMAPNTITFLGLMCSLAAATCTLIYNPTLQAGGPRWLHVLTGVSIFAYQTLDNMDGKQARRTGTSSALGMFFDHACDAINAGTTIVSMGSVMGTGWSTHLFITYLASFIPFYLQTWEEFYSHQMILPPFNGPSEGLLMSIGICITSAAVGSEFFHSPLMASPEAIIQPDDSFLCSVAFPCVSNPTIRPISVVIMTLILLLIYTSTTLISSALMVLSKASSSPDDHNVSVRHSIPSALSKLLPFLVHFPCVYIYSFYCPLGFKTNPILLAIMHCSVFAEMVMHIMVVHLVGRDINIFQRYGVWVFALITYLGVYGGEENRSLEMALLIFNCGFSTILMVTNFMEVCTEFASTLNVHIFSIKTSQ